MKIQRKMYEANKALSYFVTHKWIFENENFFSLINYVKPEDRLNFDFQHFLTYDAILFIRTSLYGFRKFLLNLKDEDLEKDRKFFNNLEISTKIFRILISLLVMYALYVNYFKKFWKQ